MPQIVDSAGCFALNGMNYGFPHQGLPICLLRLIYLKIPLVILDLILTLRRLSTEDSIFRHIYEASILALSLLSNNWPILDPQILCNQCTQDRREHVML